MQVVGKVPGVLKLTKKEADKEKVLYGEEGKPTDVVATMEFEPPTHVRWARYDASGKTRFIASFYCTPAGPWSACHTRILILTGLWNCSCIILLGSLCTS